MDTNPPFPRRRPHLHGGECRLEPEEGTEVLGQAETFNIKRVRSVFYWWGTILHKRRFYKVGWIRHEVIDRLAGRDGATWFRHVSLLACHRCTSQWVGSTRGSCYRRIIAH